MSALPAKYDLSFILEHHNTTTMYPFRSMYGAVALEDVNDTDG